jgi:hypothetical protein
MRVRCAYILFTCSVISILEKVEIESFTKIKYDEYAAAEQAA